MSDLELYHAFPANRSVASHRGSFRLLENIGRYANFCFQGNVFDSHAILGVLCIRDFSTSNNDIFSTFFQVCDKVVYF